jgi:hypothetical protein
MIECHVVAAGAPGVITAICSTGIGCRMDEICGDRLSNERIKDNDVQLFQPIRTRPFEKEERKHEFSGHELSTHVMLVQRFQSLEQKFKIN